MTRHARPLAVALAAALPFAAAGADAPRLAQLDALTEELADEAEERLDDRRDAVEERRERLLERREERREALRDGREERAERLRTLEEDRRERLDRRDEGDRPRGGGRRGESVAEEQYDKPDLSVN